MVFQSFAVRLKRYVHVACNRSLVSALSPLADALLPARASDCVVLGGMAAAVAMVALLCSAASRVDFAQVWRVGGWLP
ncbi:hypothetical protein WL48_15350 [Burkholderia ubonensis]|uniref:hypothetical protein n=1 Tax=Burkholderia ubonensis TaxID=101571 RepID=UPI00075710F3|nr:hypothetical protein [Burkholderia ubonensis]KWC36202.1 hypothetical protein WL48_15350 [Burkholderia ubonensis]KWC48576.1 hypothetical protein WL49_10790 [Burkholderia ubonensis]